MIVISHLRSLGKTLFPEATFRMTQADWLAWDMQLSGQGLGTHSWHKGWDQAILGFQGSPGGSVAQGGLSILPS